MHYVSHYCHASCTTCLIIERHFWYCWAIQGVNKGKDHRVRLNRIGGRKRRTDNIFPLDSSYLNLSPVRLMDTISAIY